MTKEKNNSIISNALNDYREIQEAAERNATKKLAESFPDKFNKLLKEELDKNNKTKSVNESYKKIDESQESKDLDETETNNSVMDKENEETCDVVKEEREKDFTADVESGTPNLGKGETEKGDNFTEKPTTKQESNVNKTSLKEEFDITDLDVDGADSAIDGASPDDQVVTMEEIEREISEMENITQEKGNAFNNKIGSMKNQLQEMLNSISEMEDTIEEQKNQGGKQNYTGREKGGPTTSMIDEIDVVDNGSDELPAPPEEIDLSDEDLDEAMGIAHSTSKHVAGDHLPGKDFAQGRHKRVGSAYNENVDKKVSSLMNENKSLTKKINESKKEYGNAIETINKFKTVVGKYRDQLSEMAIYNSNLAYVNNLLVNESLNLTQEDKINVINEFKTVKTIAESKEKFNSLLSNMTEKKNTISEGIEGKVNDAIQPSSKGNLSEVVESTAYENNEEIKKMRHLMESIEGRKK